MQVIGSVLQVCLRRLVFVCTSVLRSMDRGRSLVEFVRLSRLLWKMCE